MTAIPPAGSFADTKAQQDQQASLAAPRPLAEMVDEAILSNLARTTGGMSAIALATATFDWWAHLAIAPGKQTQLMIEAGKAGARILEKSMKAASSAENPAPTIAKAIFDETENYIDVLADAGAGSSRSSRERMRFAAHLAMEAAHPDNYLWTNAEALERTRTEGGANLLRGAQMWLSDLTAAGTGEQASDARAGLRVGVDLAVTPGKVVYRNRLIELIQYEPSTQKTRPEPVFITPAWIMKYYILDLSAQNSLVRYLTEQGFTVFMISWRNPNGEDGDLSFDDYRTLGVLSALDAIGALLPERRVHAVGYCLGGTLLSVTAAALARDGDERLASLTLLAAQTDFRDPGELSLFIDEDQLQWLEASMSASGYLAGEQMAGAFQMLRSRDLLWRNRQKRYLMGEEAEEFDLLAWNRDVTRMPSRMHAEYLRRFFLNNDFVQGRFKVDGRPATISDIRAPIFALGAEKDHVAPWRSVFKIHLFADVDITFALTNGGHNAGVVSEPGRPRRRHRILCKKDQDHYVGPDDWLDVAELRDGSWWTSWSAWLAERSGAPVAAPKPKRADIASNAIAEAAALPHAPGAYVCDK